MATGNAIQSAAPAGSGSGTVTSVTAGDTSIVIGGTATVPTVETGTLDVIAADHPPAGNWSNNSHKITSLANGSAAQDAAAFGQIPTSAASIGGVTSVTAGDTSVVVGGTAAAPTVETGTLDVIATDHPPAGNWSNNSHKITSLANGSAAQDAAAFGQTLAGGDGAPLTTAGDTLIMNATPVPARLAVGTVNQVVGISGGLPAWLLHLQQQSATAVGGYTFVNGTGTIISWTAPNDGLLHRAFFYGYTHASATMTGGQINYAFTDPGGNAFTGIELIPAGITTGNFQENLVFLPVEANTTVTISQGTAMTGGAAKGWFEIWGS